MQVEIKQAATTPGFLRYSVIHDDEAVTIAETAASDTALMAEVLERAVEGIFRDGRPWMIRS